MPPPVLKSGPVTRVCHVCGRQYGLSSFDIHLKQCKKLFIAQEELKPFNERRQLPKTPPGLDGGSIKRGGGSPGDDAPGSERPTREMIEAMNRAAQETFNEHGMEKCENCGRTFAEGRLAIHAKSCRPGNAARRVEEGVAPRNKNDGGAATSLQPTKKTSAIRLPSTDREEREDASPSRPPSTSKARGSQSLAGSMASNRRKIVSQSPSTATMQSPLAPLDVDVNTLKQELPSRNVMLGIIQSKLDRWEATTLATLQEIRELRQVFAELK